MRTQIRFPRSSFARKRGAGFRWLVLIPGAFVGLCGGPVWPQDPTPVAVGLTARCYFPGTIVLTWPTSEGRAAVLYRQADDADEHELATVPAGVGHYYDVGLKPEGVFRYRVKLSDGRSLGPVPAANSPEMLVGGDFEGDALGPAKTTVAFHRAYGEPWWEIVDMRRPGGAGRCAVKIRHGKPPRRDGLHSRLLPVDPRGSYRQSGWYRTLSGSRGRIGRKLVNRDLKPAGGRIVAYSYAGTVSESEDGWQYVEQRLASLPKDSAYLQVWALAFESRNSVWYDDLSLVDERVERLARFDAQKELPALAALASKTGDSAAPEEVKQLCASITEWEAKLRSPEALPLRDYLDLVGKLDGAVRRAADLKWDLKILSLAK